MCNSQKLWNARNTHEPVIPCKNWNIPHPGAFSYMLPSHPIPSLPRPVGVITFLNFLVVVLWLLFFSNYHVHIPKQHTCLGVGRSCLVLNSENDILLVVIRTFFNSALFPNWSSLFTDTEYSIVRMSASLLNYLFSYQSVDICGVLACLRNSAAVAFLFMFPSGHVCTHQGYSNLAYSFLQMVPHYCTKLSSVSIPTSDVWEFPLLYVKLSDNLIFVNLAGEKDQNYIWSYCAFLY